MELNVFKSLENTETPISRLDGRVKTVSFLLFTVVSAVVRQWYLAALLWAAAIAVFASLKYPWHHLAHRLLMPFSIAWIVFLSLLFTTGSHAVFVLMERPFHLVVYAEGIRLGFLIMLRIMACVTWACALSFSTPMVEILETLRACRMPGIIVDIADLMVRYVFILNDTAQNMHSAQTSRTAGRLPWVEKVRGTGRIAGNILLKSIERSEKVYGAMLARGYSEEQKQPAYYTKRVTAADLRTGALLSGTAAALLTLSLLLQ